MFSLILSGVSVCSGSYTYVSASSKNNIFAKMPKKFTFSSGAGGWSTDIKLTDNGRFQGKYHDSDLGDTGPKYPNGTVYICNFSGKFTKPKRINKYTYSMKLKYIKKKGKVGKEYYKKGIKYIYSDPYGFDDAKEFRIYLPGSKMTKLPDAFKTWLYGAEKFNKLPCYGIYNVGGKEGFFELIY